MTLGEFINSASLMRSEVEVVYWSDSRNMYIPLARYDFVNRLDEAEDYSLEKYEDCEVVGIRADLTEWDSASLSIHLNGEQVRAINATHQRIVDMLEDAINNIFATLQNEEGITSGDIRPEDAFDLDEATAKVAETIERVLAYEPRKGDC